MEISRRAVLGLFAGCAVSGLALPATAVAPNRVFVIARSKNANLVCYDAQPEKTDSPLDVYWRMNAEDGRREELTLLERNLAYGYEVRQRPRPGEIVVALKAFNRRLIRVAPIEGTHQALVQIAGSAALLDKIFVQASEGGILPTVEWLDLMGRRLAGGKPVVERIRAS